MKAIVIYWQPGVFTSSPVDSGGLSQGPDADSASSTFVEQDEEVDSVGWNPRAEGDRSQAACLPRPVPHGVRTTAAWSSPGPCACVDSGRWSGVRRRGFRVSMNSPRFSLRMRWIGVVESRCTHTGHGRCLTMRLRRGVRLLGDRCSSHARSRVQVHESLRFGRLSCRSRLCLEHISLDYVSTSA